MFANGLTLSQASARLLVGGDTWSATKNGANQVAQSDRGGLIPVGPEKEKNGSKKCHYHGLNRVPALTHAFCGAAGQSHASENGNH